MCASLGPKERRSSEIAGWVALAAILHRYSGSSATALEQDLRACRDDDPIQSLLKNLRQTRPVLQAEKGDFDAGLSDRGALFGVYVAGRHLGMVDPFTKEKLVVDRDLDRHHIFPRAQFPEKSRGVADNVANIAFIKGGTNKSLGAPSPDVYLRKLPDADLMSQCIPTHRSLLELGAYPQFCDTRRTRLAEAFNDAMKRAFPDRKQVGTRAD